MFQLGEIQFIVLKVVFDATRGADQDVDSIADRFNYTESKEDVRAFPDMSNQNGKMSVLLFKTSVSC